MPSLAASARAAVASTAAALFFTAGLACEAPPAVTSDASVEGLDAAPADAARGPDGPDAAAGVADAAATSPDARFSDASTSPDAGSSAPDASGLPCEPGGPVEGSSCGICGTVQCGPDGPRCATPPETACAAFEQVLTFDVDTTLGLTVHGGGLALGDIDGDGDVDVAFAGPDRLRLYLGDGAGGFAEVVGAFAPTPRKIAGVTLVDYDADGDLDLFVTAAAPTPGLHLYDNDGAGAYTDVTAAMAFPATDYPRGVAWADYDGDGWLDAYVASYYGAPSLLLHNLGGAGFEDMAPAYGLANPMHAEFQPVWFDYDGDGDLDLFVTVDRGTLFGVPPQMYRNDGEGGFVPVGDSCGFATPIEGMGVTVGDIDGDGDLDLYVTNIGWTSGEGQMLYINNGDATFTTASVAWGVEVTDRVGWGTEMFDYDNDGDLDLAVAAQPTLAQWFGENWGAGFFDLSERIGLPAHPQNGLATADFDGDGRLDLGWLTKVIPPPGGSKIVVGAELFRNVAPSTGHWLRLELADDPPNLRAVGATVTVWVGAQQRVRLVSSGSSYLSSSDTIVHVGLGDATEVDAIEVRWPDGATTVHTGPLAVDRRLVVTRDDVTEWSPAP